MILSQLFCLPLCKSHSNQSLRVAKFRGNIILSSSHQTTILPFQEVKKLNEQVVFCMLDRSMYVYRALARSLSVDVSVFSPTFPSLKSSWCRCSLAEMRNLGIPWNQGSNQTAWEWKQRTHSPHYRSARKRSHTAISGSKLGGRASKQTTRGREAGPVSKLQQLRQWPAQATSRWPDYHRAEPHIMERLVSADPGRRVAEVTGVPAALREWEGRGSGQRRPLPLH